MNQVHVIGGGTFSHVRPHLGLASQAFGLTARKLAAMCGEYWPDVETHLHLTRMANSGLGRLETNEDVAKLLERLVALPETKAIFLTSALCDFEGSVVENTITTPSGKKELRLKTKEGLQHLVLTPSTKIIQNIRRYRKDVFLVGFKTTTSATPDEQYLEGLELLKRSSCNLVLSNDVHTRHNMVITPEQARYHAGSDRDAALRGLIEMAAARSKLHFTRSTVLRGDPIPWDSSDVPSSLRAVVDHCVAAGAYKPFLGSTVGHFAVKTGDSTFLTSRRKSDFNHLNEVGLVRVESEGADRVVAYGDRPSVGGQSQRIVFAEHPDTDCIVHFHCPLRADAPDPIPVRSQREFECGSHECGQNTSSGLRDLGGVKAVMLDRHGPNVVFNRSADPARIIEFINRNFDLEASTDEVDRRA